MFLEAAFFRRSADMLRRTAARAFGGGGEGSDVPAARHETHRDTAVERLFGDLHHRLVELVERRNAGPDAAVSVEANPSGADASGSPIAPPRRDAASTAAEDDDETASEARRPPRGGCSVGPQRTSGGALLFVLAALATGRRRRDR